VKSTLSGYTVHDVADNIGLSYTDIRLLHRMTERICTRLKYPLV